MLTGLDVLVSESFSRFHGQRLGVLCHQASVAHDFGHIVDKMLAAHCDVRRLFGPQHGPWGHTQDNMIEWEGFTDQRTGLPTFSLYAEHREPTLDMLDGLDRFVVDVQDVGCRVYTFIWTMALCMKACAKAGLAMTVLDRPNPIGIAQEGPVLEPAFASFVGLRPLPMRHGRTIGELAEHFQQVYYPGLDLDVVCCGGADRAIGDGIGFSWIPPSPNMPTLDTAFVYPGMVFLEGTNLSEGRGTTRPFETFGAPWLDGHLLCDSLNEEELPGVHFRPVSFQPGFQKHAGKLCHGAFVHVTDCRVFRPVATGLAVLLHCYRQDPNAFEWKRPPYEYEEKLMPIDILAGNSWVRKAIECQSSLGSMADRAKEELVAFETCQEKT